MFLHRPLGTTLIAAVAVSLSGCLNLNDPATEQAATDEEAIQNIMLGDMSEYADPDVRWYDDRSGSLNDPSETPHWRREVLSLDRNIVISIDDPGEEVPTAHVSMTAVTTGVLHVWMGGNDLIHYMKDFEDTATRSAMLRRSRRGPDMLGDRDRGWRLVAISGVEIASQSTSRQIQSITIQWGDQTKVVEDISELVAMEDLTRIPVNTEVAITVTTGDASDAVFLHARYLDRRTELRNNNDGTFSGGFVTGERPGPRHFVVDVLSQGSLYEPDGAYDSTAWGYPFVVSTGDISGGDDGTGVGGGA